MFSIVAAFYNHIESFKEKSIDSKGPPMDLSCLDTNIKKKNLLWKREGGQNYNSASFIVLERLVKSFARVGRCVWESTLENTQSRYLMACLKKILLR